MDLIRVVRSTLFNLSVLGFARHATRFIRGYKVSWGAGCFGILRVLGVWECLGFGFGVFAQENYEDCGDLC